MSITVNMKTSSGTSFSIQIPDDSLTIAEFKKLLVEKSNIPVEQQRLIYSGHVLKDVQTLGSYGVKDGHTVHLVRGASNSTANQASTTTPPVSQSAPSNPTEFGLPTGGFPGMGGLGGMGGASFQQMQQQLMQNPALMREMMNSPAMQSVLQNPELIRSMLMNNPQMREVIERNPEVGHVLNDPAVLRQTLEMARNPELMREMMRNTDRAMSNIESHPEGFNLLRRMYTNVQEPMLNATTPNPQQTNPFAALFGQGGQTPSTGGTPPANPNTAPLPNPWGPPSTGSSGGSVPSTGPSQGAFPSLETGGLFDPTMMSSMLQNPGVQSMMQQMFSNPELMQTAINSNPLLSSMLNQNPQMRQMFQNPDFLRQMSDPNTINALMQMQSAMQQLQGTGFMNLMNPFGANPLAPQAPSSTPSTPSIPSTPSTPSTQPTATPFDFGMFSQLMGGMGGVTQAQAPQQPPEERFKTQLEQLKEMGFYDQAQNIRALEVTNGNVQAAIERLLAS